MTVDEAADEGRVALRTTHPLRSGWIPAALLLALTGWLLVVAAEVAPFDVARFAAYLLGWVTLPGTLAWRWITARRGDRPLAEDLAIGSLVGLVLEFPVYLGCLAAGVPWAYLLWPVVVVAATVGTARGRRLWRRTRRPMPTWWSWAVAAVLGYVVLWFGRTVWGPSPSSPHMLRRTYADESFHVSLAAGLRHFFPPRLLYVDDADLSYHWLSHLHVAAASWASGVEPAVLLRSLSLPAVFGITVLAAAVIVVRLTGAPWTGVVLLLGLAVGPAVYSGGAATGAERVLSARLLISPSAGFALASTTLAMLVCIEILRRRLTGPLPWLLAALTLVATLGAKSTSLPPLVAGLVASALVVSVLGRRIDRTAVGLAAMSIGCFVVGSLLFFGVGSHDLGIEPLALTSESGRLPFWAAALACVAYLGYLSTGLGLVALVPRRGLLRPDHVFVVVVGLAGLVASLTFHQGGYSEYYFAYGVLLPILLGATLGVHRLVAAHDGRTAATLGGAAFAATLVTTAVVVAAVPNRSREEIGGSLMHQVVTFYVVPAAIVVALGVVVCVAVVRLGSRAPRGSRPATVGIVAVAVAAGLGALPVIQHGTEPDFLFGDPAQYRQLIGRDGIEAARWLRAHSRTDDRVATNAHCEDPVALQSCQARNHWMSAYTERQFLVSGWSYASWETPPEGVNPNLTYADTATLADNDAAFSTPTAATTQRLASAYDIRWLLVDLRYPNVDTRALDAVADRRFSRGDYVVYELRD